MGTEGAGRIAGSGPEAPADNCLRLSKRFELAGNTLGVEAVGIFVFVGLEALMATSMDSALPHISGAAGVVAAPFLLPTGGSVRFFFLIGMCETNSLSSSSSDDNVKSRRRFFVCYRNGIAK